MALLPPERLQIAARLHCVLDTTATHHLLVIAPLMSVSVALPFLFFFNATATTETYPLSLHDALPIWIATKFPSKNRDFICTFLGQFVRIPGFSYQIGRAHV